MSVIPFIISLSISFSLNDSTSSLLTCSIICLIEILSPNSATFTFSTNEKVEGPNNWADTTAPAINNLILFFSFPLPPYYIFYNLIIILPNKYNVITKKSTFFTKNIYFFNNL